MKYVCVVVLLLLCPCFAQAQDGCYPAQCMIGYHSVCHKECDPNGGPACMPVCKCHCEKDRQFSESISFQEQIARLMSRAFNGNSWTRSVADISQTASCSPDKEVRP